MVWFAEFFCGYEAGFSSLYGLFEFDVMFVVDEVAKLLIDSRSPSSPVSDFAIVSFAEVLNDAVWGS